MDIHRKTIGIVFIFSLLTMTSTSVLAQDQIPHGGVLRWAQMPGDHANNFNPFAADYQLMNLPWTLIYETLLCISEGKGGEITPDCGLATSFAWSKDAMTLNFSVRNGVKWHDGEPFTAGDVAFTFNYILAHPEIDLNGLSRSLSKAESVGETAVLRFKVRDVPSFWYIADQIPIIPEHIWSKIDNPGQFADTEPIGTGPFKLKQYTASAITLDRNPDYWLAGKPYVDQVISEQFKSSLDINLALTAHQLDVGNQFMADANNTFVAKDPVHNHYWTLPSQMWPISVNNKKYPLSLKEVRWAIADAINRHKVVSKILYNYTVPAGPSGIVPQIHRQWWNSSIPEFFEDNNPDKAIGILEGLGFKRGGDGIFVTPNGTRLSFEYITCSAWSDDIETSKLYAQDLKRAGIEIILRSNEFSTYANKMATGDYDMGYYWSASGPNPYYALNMLLNSKNSAPLGQTAASNYARWEDPKTDALLEEFAGATDLSEQISIMKALESIFYQNLPYIPSVQGPCWVWWQDETLEGWNTPQDPYAIPVWGQTTDENLLTAINVHLKTPTTATAVETGTTTSATTETTTAPALATDYTNIYVGIVAAVVIAIVAVAMYRRRPRS